MIDKIELGKSLKKMRVNSGVSTYQLEKMGLSRTIIASIESGTSSYTIDSFLKYCSKCGINITFERD